MFITFLDVITCLAALTLAFIIWSRQNRAKLPSHPPGPAGLPFIGNLRDIPPDPAWSTYLEWSKKYSGCNIALMSLHLYSFVYPHIVESDIVRMNVFGSNIIVLNSLSASVDLLERRSSNYSTNDLPENEIGRLIETHSLWATTCLEIVLVRLHSFWRLRCKRSAGSLIVLWD